MTKTTLISELTPAELRKVWAIYHSRAGSESERRDATLKRAAIDLPQIGKKVIWNLLINRQRVL